MNALWYGALAGAGFLAGSIPTGLLIGRRHGIDIRAHGSGNIGATNVGRVLGRRAGLTCFALDMLKGFAPSLATGLVAGSAGVLRVPGRDAWLWLIVMASPVLGHMFCPWLRLRGGKGVATALGALLGVFPALTIPGVLSAIAWLTVLRLTSYVGLSSVVGAGLLPVFVGGTFVVGLGAAGPALPAADALRWAVPFLALSSALAAVVIIKHRANIARVMRGTEPRVSWMGPGARPRSR